MAFSRQWRSLSAAAFFLCAPLLLPDPGSLVHRGAEALHRGDLVTAVRVLSEAVREQPANAHALKLLGIAYSRQQRDQSAQDSFERACESDPREQNACYFLGRAYYYVNRFEDSLATLQAALRTRASDRNLTLAGIAEAFEALGRTSEAERTYKDAAASGNSQALVAYGMFLFHQGRGSQSLPLLRQAGAKKELALVTRSLEAGSNEPFREFSPSQVRFKAQTLPMVVRNGAEGDKQQVETMLAGVAVFDYDKDGWPDIFVANGAHLPDLVKSNSSFHNRLFRNNHDGTFSDVTERAGLSGAGYSMGAAAADYDNDGWTDLFVTGVRSNTLYHNNGDGTFTDVTAQAGIAQDGLWSVAAGWFDYDNDGRLDLLVVRYVNWSPENESRCGLEKPGYRTYCHPRFYAPLPNALYHNEGNGRFRDVSQESGIGRYPGKGMGVAFGDYDGDGLLDVFVANDTVRNYLFHNDGRGHFSEVGAEAGVSYAENGNETSSMGVDFRDYDNDGREDLFVTTLSNERFSLFRNIGSLFANTTAPSRISSESLPWSGWSTGMFDFNNDGFKDIFVAGGHAMDNAELTTSRASRQPNLLFLNQGNGTFQLLQLPGAAFHRGAAFGDFNRDGRMDVVVTRLNESPVVLQNVSAKTGHWIEVRLDGRRSNRDGIGALLHVSTVSGEQWNRVTTSVGYASSSDRTVHFGLGDDDRVATLEIRWPSGVRQVLHGLAADRLLVVPEPDRE
ncbi:MAG TPA: FG-GAP-like repeat-containing protein [Bryobacteraceae bacterium]|nr:FG-GAP-like repeat-containing protein [Bryobacteraceae bacterium]